MSPSICLIACSKAQKKYFDALTKYSTVPTNCLWYKSLRLPQPFTAIPWHGIYQQVQYRLTRKIGQSNHSHSALYIYIWHILAMAHGVLLYWIYHRVMSAMPHSHIGLWNGKKFRQAIMVLAAKQCNKELLFFETGPLPGYSCVDTHGVNAFASIPKEPNFYKSITINDSENTPRTSYSDDYIFVPFQVVSDSNIYMHSPWIKSMFQLFATIKQVAQDSPHIQFVFKQHPACNKNYQALIQAAESAPNLCFMNDANTTELVRHARCVITINSTVGIEALQCGKPLIVLGDALYSIQDLVLTATDINTLMSAVHKAERWLPNRDLIHGFLHYLQYHYAVYGDAMKNPTPEHFSAMDTKLTQLIRSSIGHDNVL